MKVNGIVTKNQPLPAKEHYLPFGTIELPVLGGADSKSWKPSKWKFGRLSGIPLERSHHLYPTVETLERHRLIRLAYKISEKIGKLRIYLLPQDVDRSRYPDLSVGDVLALKTLVEAVNRSASSWISEQQHQNVEQKYESPLVEDDSLFYIFNTLDPPRPDPDSMKDSRTRETIHGILHNPDAVVGLRTLLYPYQRRSAAVMIQRETRPKLILDPTLTAFTNPTGQTIYIDKHSAEFLSAKVEFEEARGGILAETMGLGKTLICLTTILATRGDYPEIPPQYQDTGLPLRQTVASLRQMAASAVIRAQLPWRQHFRKLLLHGEHHAGCVSALEKSPPSSYWLPAAPGSRTKSPDAGTRIFPTSITLIIVPDNLISQWQQEIERHVEADYLSVYVFDDPKDRLPHESELAGHDILLMTKTSFKQELSFNTVPSQHPGQDVFCPCPPIETTFGGVCFQHRNSPLQKLHFLRMIVDEGHQFASSGLQSDFLQAIQRIHVERRWIVSGTPSGLQALMGVEVELAATSERNRDTNDTLTLRKSPTRASNEQKDLERLGLIVTRFLRVKPWCNPRSSTSFASWKDIVLPAHRRDVSLRDILSSLIVRHRIQDIEAELPPLHNRVVHLRPSYFDKLSINLFVLLLTANAVTSERVDQDYMFHPKNRKALDALIRNLRHSGFYWTGHNESDLHEAVRVSVEYLASPDRQPSDADRVLLESAVHHAREALQSSAWTALSRQDEMGMFVEHFPADAKTSWALCDDSEPLLMSAAQLRLAQKSVNEHLYASNPLEPLSDASKSIAARSTCRPKSTKSKLQSIKPDANVADLVSTPTASSVHAGAGDTLRSSLKPASASSIPPDSPVVRTQLCGTASAKLSYLIDQIARLHTSEKILVFYEADHIAWYIAQALEIMSVEHLIYGGGISNSRLTVYLDTFNTTSKFRVLLMDLRKAAQGLHVAAASRVFFVNPVWQPMVEAQAIKRAHRIGQQHPVHVETLLLKDTLEDQMFQRRTAMTVQEHQLASKSLLDDRTMSDLIKNVALIPDLGAGDHMAPLEQKQQIFARGATILADGHPDDDLVISHSRRASRYEAILDAPNTGALVEPTAVSTGTSISLDTIASEKRKVNFGALDSLPISEAEPDYISPKKHFPPTGHHVAASRKVAFVSPPPSLSASTDTEDSIEPRKKRKVNFSLPDEDTVH